MALLEYATYSVATGAIERRLSIVPVFCTTGLSIVPVFGTTGLSIVPVQVSTSLKTTPGLDPQLTVDKMKCVERLCGEGARTAESE